MRNIVVALILMATPALGDDNDFQAQNLVTVTKNLELCRASGCAPCGQFYYVGRTLRVGYNQTSCEYSYQRKLEDAEAARIDHEIRSKYGSKK